ncbi:uncharacterized protein SOCEGT47_028660 [Sorangium cellulosum]|uniref:Uncharacterized protein n=1 Tax=Sorangium cellulosum TaxID=56 RepID=A0A4P2PZM6_SORCE|nr:uncharacterized protein SOCEGT47_028660 [Sorangium cellulosum]
MTKLAAPRPCVVNDGIAPVRYEDTERFSLTRAVLLHRDRSLRERFRADGEDP